MAGSGAQGVNLVRTALEMLQKGLPSLPMGSDIHSAVLKSITDISKHVGQVAGAGDPAAIVQQLAQLARQTQQAPVPPALGSGGAPPPPGGPPPGLGAPPPMAA
jgi:hypothetical protein